MSIRAVLLDLDGTVYQQGRAITGAARAISTLKGRGLTVGFITNTTSRPLRLVAQRCASYGLPIGERDIASALVAGNQRLKALGLARVMAVVTDAAREDLLAGGIRSDGKPEAVVVGDIDPDWNAAILNRAFRAVMDGEGVRLIALSSDRYWLTDDGLRLDCGTFVAALEYATGVKAELVGKPSFEFFRAAHERLAPGCAPGEVLVVGDDAWSDVGGAQRAGFEAMLVKTGKFRPDVLEHSGIRPGKIIDSIADIASELT